MRMVFADLPVPATGGFVYMKLADLKPGDRLTDFEFWGCVPVNAVRVVRADRLGVYVKCGE
jgi:hypothetical protein